jgi:hypothetical protein
MNDLTVVTRDQEEWANALIETKGDNLPMVLEDAIKAFEFTDLKARAFKVVADKTKNIDDATEVYLSSSRSAKKWGIASLYAQKHLGELTREVKPEQSVQDALHGKNTGLKKAGVSRGIYQDAEQFAKHPDILEETIQAYDRLDDAPNKTAVLNRIRLAKAEERAKVNQERANDKIDKKRPKAVADYYDAVKIYKHAIELAIIAAERDKFDPAGKNFLIKKHGEIQAMQKQLEGVL